MKPVLQKLGKLLLSNQQAFLLSFHDKLYNLKFTVIINRQRFKTKRRQSSLFASVINITKTQVIFRAFFTFCRLCLLPRDCNCG